MWQSTPDAVVVFATGILGLAAQLVTSDRRSADLPDPRAMDVGG
jgi:hypothetical protein